MVGIYGIQSPSGKIYIGQSWNIDTRFKYYKSHKSYQQPALSNSINKYGFDSHELKVLHELPNDVSQEVLDRYEILYMQFYKDAGIVLLNTKEGGRGGKHNDSTRKILSEQRIGIKKSEETKKKMSEWQIGTKHSVERIANMVMGRRKYFKPIIQFDLNGVEIKRWNTSAEAARYLNINQQAISQCLRGITKTSCGFKWQYANGK